MKIYQIIPLGTKIKALKDIYFMYGEIQKKGSIDVVTGENQSYYNIRIDSGDYEIEPD